MPEKTVFILSLVLLDFIFNWSSVQAYHYHAYPVPIMYAAESNQQPMMLPQGSNNGNGFVEQWSGSLPYLPVSMLMGQESQMVRKVNDVASDSICQNGFVEHCLMKANQDNEQRSQEIGSNKTESEKEMFTGEFDGMCHTVIRFIDCVNLHYVKCSPQKIEQQQQKNDPHQLANVKDVFYQSWTQLCSPNSQTRKNYLKHASCIKQALVRNNGQEQCQAKFQGYFFSNQFSMDSVENTVQYGCCAFNEWQYCINSLISKQCGQEATKAVGDLIEQASGGLVSSLCEKKSFGRKSRACLGKKSFHSNKLQALDSKMNATLQKYISILGDFIERLPDDENDEETPGFK